VNANKLSIMLIGVGSALIIAAITLMALVATDVIDNAASGNSDLETVVGFGEPIKLPTPGPSPTPSSQFAPGADADIARLRIPAVGIDAPVVTRGTNAAGVMQTPDNAVDTAWYDFTARPGFDGNAVFSGHVDYVKVGKAVFWTLKDLKPDDEIQVQLEDGTIYTYKVSFLKQYDAASAPIEEIVGSTPQQSVTLITCSGTFNNVTRQYDKRLIVRAERVT
jgi:LPXTG-site transpeptidase (sortase) family protein